METILFYLKYYANVLIELCGFDGGGGSNALGWFVVGVALLLVIGAFYIGVTSALWPGERDPSHIKYRILDDEETPRAH